MAVYFSAEHASRITANERMLSRLSNNREQREVREPSQTPRGKHTHKAHAETGGLALCRPCLGLAYAVPAHPLRARASPFPSCQGDQPRRREYQPRKAQTPVSMMMSPRRIASCDTCADPRRAVVSTSLVHLVGKDKAALGNQGKVRQPRGAAACAVAVQRRTVLPRSP